MMPNFEPADPRKPLRTLDESQLRSVKKLKVLLDRRLTDNEALRLVAAMDREGK